MVYVYVNESSADCDPEIIVYKELDDAKRRVRSMLEEFTETDNYKIDREEKARAKQEFHDNDGMDFSVKISDEEVLRFYVEQKEIY